MDYLPPSAPARVDLKGVQEDDFLPPPRPVELGNNVRPLDNYPTAGQYVGPTVSVPPLPLSPPVELSGEDDFLPPPRRVESETYLRPLGALPHAPTVGQCADPAVPVPPDPPLTPLVPPTPPVDQNEMAASVLAPGKRFFLLASALPLG